MAETIGYILAQARSLKGVPLEEVSKTTHIRVHYLEALETDDFASLPSYVQGRGFLRLYADYLGLDAKPLLATWNNPNVEPIVDSNLELISEEGESKPENSSVQPVSVIEETISANIPIELNTDQEGLSLAHDITSSSAQIFQEIGNTIRSQRELLNLSLAEVERNTKLRLHYLQAMENGDIEGLPSIVQARGMLSNYAQFLNLDAETLLLRYADALQTRRQEKLALLQPPTTRPSANPSRPSKRGLGHRVISLDMVVGASLIIGLFAFIVWGAGHVLTLQNDQKPQPTAPSIADVLLASPSASPSMTLDAETINTPSPSTNIINTEAAVTETTPEIPDSSSPIQVYIISNQRAWMKIIVDGKIAFQGRVIPGGAYSYFGTEKIELLTGSGGALQVFFNQIDLGILGQNNEVIDQVYTLQGVEVPTATITMTPTRTTIPTSTPRPTETPRISPTPTLPVVIP